MIVNFVDEPSPSKKPPVTKEVKRPASVENKAFLKYEGDRKQQKTPNRTKVVKINEIATDSKNSDNVMCSVKVHQYVQLSERMKTTLEKMLHLDFLTWIQEKSIPYVKSGRHTLIKSPSGTGKTLSYAIPLIDHLADRPTKTSRRDGVFVLVLVPTKELAKQTLEVFQKILHNFVWIQVGALYGCDKRKAEKARLRKGINILICTPGRLYDHLLNTKSFDLLALRTFVIDEADMLLDLGYEHKINTIFDEIHRRYGIGQSIEQVVLLSATLNQRVNRLSSLVLRDPVIVDATPFKGMALAYEMLSCNQKLVQTVIIVPIKWRLVALIWFLCHARKGGNNFKTIIFFPSIASVMFHARLIGEMCRQFRHLLDPDLDPSSSTNLVTLHGDMEIKERLKLYDDFTKAKAGILLATDVAGRGLDFKDVHWVVQYSPARNPVEYVHRVGRTARAGSDGYAVVFLAPHELEYLSILQESGMEVNKRLELKDIAQTWITAASHNSTASLSDQAVQAAGSELHTAIKQTVAASESLTVLAAKCFTSSVKAYASYPRNLKKYFNPKLLHTGHLAESFGLSETPKNINKISRESKYDPSTRKKPIKTHSTLTLEQPRVAKAKLQRRVPTRPSVMTVSEYTSTVTSGPQIKRRDKI